MPNASCFLIAYLLVFVTELVRFASRSERSQLWSTRASVGMFAIALLTHTLYLIDRVLASQADPLLKAFSSWQDWGLIVAWLIAVAFAAMIWQRSDKQIGLFVLPLILAIVALAVAFPSASPNANPQATASFWRLMHSAAMLLGTMLVTLGFASAAMYLAQAWRLKHRVGTTNRLRLPSLEYLQTLGRQCILGSAAAVGFGVVSGAIMNLTQDGRVAWTDRGILFSGGLFAWLCVAAVAQWASSHRGRGEWTAALSILSFIIVVISLAVVVTTPHGTSPSATTKGDTRSGDTVTTKTASVKSACGSKSEHGRMSAEPALGVRA